MSNLIAQRRSVAALVLKNFEGMLEKPTKGEQFLAIQPDFALNPNFTTTENVELKDDIMSGKNIVTGEAPTGTMSHYLVGSGTAGKAPEYGAFLQASFGGYRSLSAEQTLVAGSTVGVLKLSTAGAAMFKKGDAALIKDTVNGWSVRPVQSVSGTDVTLGFNLEKAPGTGVKVGRFLTYFPISDNLPVFDIWHYIGGGESGVENVQDCRVTSISMAANAKDLINASFSFEGTAYRFNENYTENFTLFSYNNKFYIRKTANGEPITVTLEAKSYADGDALAAEIQAKTRTQASISSFTAVFAAKKFTFDATAAFLPDFSLGSEAPEGNMALGDILGFSKESQAGKTPDATAKTSVNDAKMYRNYGHGLTEVYDDTDPIIARGQQVFIGDATDNICIDSSSVTIAVNTPKALITSICEESGNYRSLINSRSATISVSAHLEDDDRRFFDRFQKGTTTNFAFVAGKKTSEKGKLQWKPGETFVFYGSPASITNWAITGSNDVYMLDLELTCYSSGDGKGSIFLSFV